MQDNNENKQENSSEENCNQIQQSNSNSEIEEIIQRLPENVPSEVKEKIKQELTTISFSAMGEMRRSMPFENIMQPCHLTALIENADKDSEREYQDSKLSKLYILLIVIIALLFVLVLTNLLVDKNPDLLIKILSHSFAAILGLAGGYGLKCKIDNE